MDSQTRRPPWPLGRFVLLALGMLLFHWVRLAFAFGFQHVDEDGAIMWCAATEFAQGHFHEPRFYGQDYNSMLEGLLAAPWLLLGLEHRVALPLVTCALSLLPFLLLAWVAFREGKPHTAFAVLVVPITMPIEYGMISFLPRGFVTGLAVSAVGILLASCSRSRMLWFVAGLTSVLGISLNPNALLLVAGAGPYLLIRHRREASRILVGALGGGIAVLGHLWVQGYYDAHPDLVLHAKDVSWSWLSLQEGLASLGRHFAHVVPGFPLGGVLPIGGWLWIPLFAIAIGLWLKKRDIAAAIGTLGFVVSCVLSLGVNRVQDGVDSVFYPYSRMFLALPIFIAFMLTWSDVESFFSSSRKRLRRAVSCLCVFFVIQQALFWPLLWVAWREETYLVVRETEDVAADCHRLARHAEECEVDLVVFNGSKLLTYAVASQQQIATLLIGYERRAWRIQEERERQIEGFLVHGVKKGDALVQRALRSGWTVEFVDRDVAVFRGEEQSVLESLASLGVAPR